MNRIKLATAIGLAVLMTGCSWLSSNGPKLAVDIGELGACVIVDFETGVPFTNCLNLAAQMGVQFTEANAQAIVAAHVAAKTAHPAAK